jgi:prepilin-type N-terminal cleavage/methylation domain-containing protein/prepilin-type processing-associated H-X9-DG protein
MICTRSSGSRSSGFTIVELLVVIAIIGTLVGLLLPAVQAARESARLSACANKMKQMGLAVLNYESAKKQFPSGRIGSLNPGYSSPGGGTSAHYQILPYMEEQDTFNSSNLNKMIAGFICPSTITPKATEPRTCYLFSAGDAAMTDNQGFSPRGFVVPASAQFVYYDGPSGQSATSYAGSTWKGTPYFRQIKHIVDGLSNSLMLAERAYGKSGPSTDLRTGYAIGTANWNTATTTYDNCSGYVVGGSYDSAITRGDNIGDTWHSYLPGNSCFNTIFPPNGPSCGGSLAGYWGCGPTATSFHAGNGVNAVFCDGAVRFISGSINATYNSASPYRGSRFETSVGTAMGSAASPYGVWGALGSICGGESVRLD